MPENAATTHLSGRVGSEDYKFLMSHPIPGTTASEKLRHVVSFFRKYHESLSEFEDSLIELQRLQEPAKKSIKKAEFETNKSSELVDRILQIVPEIFARTVTTRITGSPSEKTAQLHKMEESLLHEMLKLFEGILRMDLTPESPTYNPKIIEKNISNINALVRLKISKQSQPD